MLDNIGDFIATVFSIKESFSPGSATGMGGGGFGYQISINKNCNGSIYCPKCGGERRISVNLIYTEDSFFNIYGNVNSREEAISNIKKHMCPSLWSYICNQCDTIFIVTFYEKNTEPEMAIFPSCNGGVVTPNTPIEVSYYLDQAYRAKSVGANSACIAMYRGALDQLLHQQGYTSGMLGVKLDKLEKDLKAGNAPKWAEDLDIDFLSCINQLGSGSIHPNDGDIEKQKELDNQLITVVDIVFTMLLDSIYEKPVIEQGRLSALKDKSKHFSNWRKS